MWIKSIYTSIMLDNIIEKSDGLRSWLMELLETTFLPEWTFALIDFGLRAIILFFLSFLLYYVSKKILLFYTIKFVRKSKSKFDDYLLHRRVFHRISHIAPAIVIYVLDESFFGVYPTFLSVVNTLSIIYMIGVVFWTLQAVLAVLEDIYNTKPYAIERPIRSYIQLLNLTTILVGALIIISYLFDVQVTRIFAGLGAMAAVLMLIFKDTILGFVAGIQLSANKMMRVGDWISMPTHNADGTVLEVTLNTVKVQNWDRTITTIPTYALVASPFMNWRGMEESGGRRITRSINVDMRSVRFCTPEMLNKFKKIHMLKDYIEQRQTEIENYNKELGVDESITVNGRRMTNLGVFRKYLENYCIQHPRLNTEMTFLIRHLQPSEKGIPIQVYVFSKEKAWAVYEEIQADIFDHILAIIPEFGLRVFQEPSGDDLQMAISGLGDLLQSHKPAE
jgi:miniconductance mechanosensitive channel